tara:strand:+ start:351 stop:524 length:174 start_codon:yes stop_codon:yes gene_type:complete
MTFEERFKQDYDNAENLKSLFEEILFSTHDYNLLSDIDKRIITLKGIVEWRYPVQEL